MTAPVPGLSDERLALDDLVRYERRVSTGIEYVGPQTVDVMMRRLLGEVCRLREERDKAQRQVEAVEALGRRLDPVDPKTIRAALAIEDGQT